MSANDDFLGTGARQAILDGCHDLSGSPLERILESRMYFDVYDTRQQEDLWIGVAFLTVHVKSGNQIRAEIL